MTTSGVSFEKETKALSKRVLDFFERVRYAYLSAKENPKENGKKWKETVKSIREEYNINNLCLINIQKVCILYFLPKCGKECHITA